MIPPEMFRLSWLLGVALLAACSSRPVLSARDASDANDTGATLGAKSEGERELLKEAASLPSGAPRRVGGATVVAEAPYAAASGRTCRALHVTLREHQASQRLACTDGRAWFFVPDVFGASSTE